MKAIVLAGGKGTRLRPLTYTKPKPLLPLAGQPAISHLIRKLAQEGIGEIILTTNYFGGRLRAELGDGSRYGVRIHHVEESSPLGTAGSVKNCESLIDGTFLVVQGDNQFEFDPKHVIQLHRKLSAQASVALVEVSDATQYGIAELSKGRIIRFLEKPEPEECFSNLANSGFYVLEPEVLDLVPEGQPFDFSRDLFPLMLESQMLLGGFRATGFWIDIGDPGSYISANEWALRRQVEGEPGQSKIVREPSTSVSETATVTGPVYLGSGVHLDARAIIGPYTCVGTGSEISSGARIISSLVYENTSIGAGAILDSCVVAENCKIGNGVRIERNAVVGAGTELGDYTHVAPNSEVGPWSVTQKAAKVNGTLALSKTNLERISDLLQRTNELLGLTREEGRVCSALLELGEADAQTIAEASGLPISRIDSLLSELERRGMISILAHAPKVFILADSSNQKDVLKEKT